MTDSDSDVSNNVFPFQNGQTIVCAKGPNTNISNLSLSSQITSSIHMPRPFDRQRYAESVGAQHSIYYRRETSPMSVYSACDAQKQNFRDYYQGINSRQSMFNGRSGSPMSMRSIDSSASANDIAFALRNGQFSRYELKLIKEAYQHRIGRRNGKRVEKRRGKRRRRRSGYDSGELGSDSSISSDDCRSVKTFAGNMSSARSYKENMASTRLARNDIDHFKRTVRNNTMLSDCTYNFKQNCIRNMISVNSNTNSRYNFNNTMNLKSNSINSSTQKDRFGPGFVLPTQRFDQSIASSSIPETTDKAHKNIGNNKMPGVRNHIQNRHNNNFDETDEEIFSAMPRCDKSYYNDQTHHKRKYDDEDEANQPDKKKIRVTSTSKNSLKSQNSPPQSKMVSLQNNNVIQNKFEFLKPMLPVRKPKIQERLIAKSAAPLIDVVQPITSNIQDTTELLPPCNIQEKSKENNSIESKERNNSHHEQDTTQNSEVSMRPSFIKRKLFTQKLDVAEKANLSTESMNSPQTNVYSNIHKEKNKARKLVTNQSCLNRDVTEDTNFLDLIHKIVPPDQISNQSSMDQTKNELAGRNKTTNDKWDVTSILSMCNDHDVSDTYTDEEIFMNKGNKKKEKQTQNSDSNINLKSVENKSSCSKQKVNEMKEMQNLLCSKVVLEKIDIALEKKVHSKNINPPHNITTKKQGPVKSFWDTSSESEAEYQNPVQKLKETLFKATAPHQPVNSAGTSKYYAATTATNNTGASKEFDKAVHENSFINNATDPLRKLDFSTLTVRSHRMSKKNKCFNETCLTEPLSKKNPEKMIQKKECDMATKKPVSKCTSETKHQDKTLYSNTPNKKAVSKCSSKKNDKNKNKATEQTGQSISDEVSNNREGQSEKGNNKTPIQNKTKENSNTREKILTRSSSKKRLQLNTSRPIFDDHDRHKKSRKDSQGKKSKDTKTKSDKKILSNNKSDSQSEKQNQTKSHTQKEISPKDKVVKNGHVNRNSKPRAAKNNDTKLKPESQNSDKSATQAELPTGRPIRTCRTPSKNRSTEVLKTSNSNISSDAIKILRRPIRSCRTPSQNRSTEVSKSSNPNISCDAKKTLRSRVLDVSLIETNESSRPGSRKNIQNNNLSRVCRKSDISFDLNDKIIPRFKRNVAN